MFHLGIWIAKDCVFSIRIQWKILTKFLMLWKTFIPCFYNYLKATDWLYSIYLLLGSSVLAWVKISYRYVHSLLIVTEKNLFSLEQHRSIVGCKYQFYKKLCINWWEKHWDRFWNVLCFTCIQKGEKRDIIYICVLTLQKMVSHAVENCCGLGIVVSNLVLPQKMPTHCFPSPAPLHLDPKGTKITGWD